MKLRIIIKDRTRSFCAVLSVVWLLNATATGSKIPPRAAGTGLQEKRTEQLDERYTVTWQADFNNSKIDFWINANTTGYVGFGLSNSGQMDGADLVVGGVNSSGFYYFNDYHGVGHQPVLDSVQNWEVLNITESNNQMFLHLRRDFDTCDANDTQITDGTVKIIWSLGADDTFQKHDIRGALAVNILDPALPATDLSKFDTFNFTQTINVSADKGTIYSCSIHKRTRPSPNKTQIVAFKPKFESPDALRLTHHFNVYVCRVGKDENADDIFRAAADKPAQDCWGDNEVTQVADYCYVSVYAWSFGGRVTVLPEDIGIPWGEVENEYFLVEIHVDNQKNEEVSMESGVTLYYTYGTRPIEAGVFAVGLVVNPGTLVPPNTKDWTLAGHCSPSCLNPNIPDTGINIFNVNLHSHISSRKMKFRHFRNGKELPWIAKDDTYDFDFQENRPLQSYRNVQKGDHLTVECTYDSNWKSGSAVIGGKSSYDEMCMVFALYYPRTPVEACFSGHDKQVIFERYGVTKASYNASTNFVVDEPLKWQNRTFNDILDKEVNWTESNRKELNEFLRFGAHDELCFTSDKIPSGKAKYLNLLGTSNPYTPGMKARDVIPLGIKYPEFDKEYEETAATCSGGHGVRFMLGMLSISMLMVLANI